MTLCALRSALCEEILTWPCPCAKKALPQRGWQFNYRFLRHRFCIRWPSRMTTFPGVNHPAGFFT